MECHMYFTKNLDLVLCILIIHIEKVTGYVGHIQTSQGSHAERQSDGVNATRSTIQCSKPAHL